MLELIADSGEKIWLNANNIVCLKEHTQENRKGTMVTTINNFNMKVKNTPEEIVELIKKL